MNTGLPERTSFPAPPTRIEFARCFQADYRADFGDSGCSLRGGSDSDSGESWPSIHTSDFSTESDDDALTTDYEDDYLMRTGIKPWPTPGPRPPPHVRVKKPVKEVRLAVQGMKDAALIFEDPKLRHQPAFSSWEDELGPERVKRRKRKMLLRRLRQAESSRRREHSPSPSPSPSTSSDTEMDDSEVDDSDMDDSDFDDINQLFAEALRQHDIATGMDPASLRRRQQRRVLAEEAEPQPASKLREQRRRALADKERLEEEEDRRRLLEKERFRSLPHNDPESRRRLLRKPGETEFLEMRRRWYEGECRHNEREARRRLVEAERMAQLPYSDPRTKERMLRRLHEARDDVEWYRVDDEPSNPPTQPSTQQAAQLGDSVNNQTSENVRRPPPQPPLPSHFTLGRIPRAQSPDVQSVIPRHAALHEPSITGPNNFTHIRHFPNLRGPITSTLVVSTAVHVPKNGPPTVAVYFGPSNPHNLRLTLPPPQSPRDSQNAYRASLFALIAAVRAAAPFCQPPSSSSSSLPRPAEQTTHLILQTHSSALIHHLYGEDGEFGPDPHPPVYGWSFNSWRTWSGSLVYHRDLWMTLLSDMDYSQEVAGLACVVIRHPSECDFWDVQSDMAFRMARRQPLGGTTRPWKGAICAADAAGEVEDAEEFPYYYNSGWIEV
ncbi:hypothetical protein CGCSCA4_v009084 [Colletotrichum siamense]|uniref:Uncharacterized protein n=1 Tax=Colletotrichum siamense TaxID=690259 RepID=A0A9P5BR60_COLSI|nr:hypothetical protein CGCSCA4_v009084 [Colletotrichum siamense]KAF4847104.1 hypothetical protein CGCSCA2_v012848 [Colletotrichum siamense]